MTTSFNTIVTKYGPTYYIVEPNPKAKKLLYCTHYDPMMIMMTGIWTLYEDKKTQHFIQGSRKHTQPCWTNTFLLGNIKWMFVKSLYISW